MKLPDVRMENLIIREAGPPDDEAIGTLLIDAFLSAYARKLPEVVYGEARRAELRAVAEKRRRATVWVAELEGRVVGTVALFRPDAEGTEAWLPNAADLRHLATDPALHGRGLSQPLLDAAEQRASEWKVDAICLHVRKGASGVARMYERRGFRRAPEGDLKLPDVELAGYVMHLPR